MKMNKHFLAIFLSIVSNFCVAQNTDTLRVSQSDTTVFEKKIFPARLHYSPIPFANLFESRFRTSYELINPQNGAYYFIYDNKKQLIKEGLYTVRKFTIKDKTEEYGALIQKFTIIKRMEI